MEAAFGKMLSLYMRKVKMEIITFLECLANHVHYDVGLDNLIDQQPNDIKTAFQTNNSELLHRQFGNKQQYTYNPSDVVQILK